MKLILKGDYKWYELFLPIYLCNRIICKHPIILLDFNAPVPAFPKLFNSVRKKFFGCVFNQFSLCQCCLYRMKTFLLDLLSWGRTYRSLCNIVHCDSAVFPYYSFNGLNIVPSPWSWRPSWSLLIAYKNSSLFEVMFPHFFTYSRNSPQSNPEMRIRMQRECFVTYTLEVRSVDTIDYVSSIKSVEVTNNSWSRSVGGVGYIGLCGTV
jgi:hypothetical protein